MTIEANEEESNLAFPQTNLILDLLPDELRAAIVSRSETVGMPVNTVLYEPEESPRYVHFLTSGVASVVTPFTDGAAVEVGLAGREGIPECLHLLGPQTGSTRCFMQIAGAGLRINFKLFEREFMHHPILSRMVLRYVQHNALVLSQLAGCNRIHEVEERFARWLLMAEDKIGDPMIHLTQEFLAQMLGTRRTSVTLVAGTLQRAGLIQYSRGKVRIIDRQALEDAACECYPITQKLAQNLYK